MRLRAPSLRRSLRRSSRRSSRRSLRLPAPAKDSATAAIRPNEACRSLATHTCPEASSRSQMAEVEALKKLKICVEGNQTAARCNSESGQIRIRPETVGKRRGGSQPLKTRFKIRRFAQENDTPKRVSTRCLPLPKTSAASSIPSTNCVSPDSTVPSNPLGPSKASDPDFIPRTLHKMHSPSL